MLSPNYPMPRVVSYEETMLMSIFFLWFPNEGYNFASHPTSIRGLHTKLWASKVVESHFENFETPTWES